MAEQVNQRIEDMIGELEQMKRINLYTNDEIREISRKRKEFEYRIQRKTKSKDDFVHYITYDSTLLEDIRLRRKQINMQEKKGYIEFPIARRLNRLFQQMIERFQDDLEVYFQYIKFCNSVGFKESISSIIARMLQIHGDKPKIWQLASKWEYQEMKSFDNARKFLLKGLQRHPQSQVLYLELFHLELTVLQNSEDEKKELQMKRAAIVWKNALQNINTARFHIQLCDISKMFDCAISITDELREKLWEEHCDGFEVWSYFASQELLGIHWDKMNEYLIITEGDLPENVTNCVSLYETALEKNPKEENCTKVIHELLKLNIGVLLTESDKVKVVKTALQKGHDLGILSQDLYTFWIELLQKDGDTSNSEIIQIVQSACQKKPQFENVWVYSLLMAVEDEKKMKTIFLEAKKHLKPENTLELWNAILNNTKDFNKVKKLYQESTNCALSVSSALRSKFLKLFFEYGDIQSTRQLYEAYIKSPPVQLEEHETMIEIEANLQTPSTKYHRRCYDLATQHFGKSDHKIWLRYIKFEVSLGDPKLSSQIYSRAVASLDPEESDVFIKEYTLSKV